MKRAVWLFVLLLFCGAVTSQDADLWGDEWEDEAEVSAWQWSGSVNAAYGHRTASDPLFDSQKTLAEWRGQLGLSHEADGYQWRFKVDGWYDAVTNGFELDWRQFELSFSPLKNTDVSLGRQIATWGTGDLLFLNDFFPKDWPSFFAGREVDYLKAPITAVRMQHYFKPINIDWVITPSFEPDRFITGERFGFYSPLAQSLVGGSELVRAKKPSKSEWAVRIFKQFKGWEWALYGYHGFDKQPLGLDENGRLTHHRKQSWGMSMRGTLLGGVVHAEMAHHKALDDPDGTKINVQNGQNRWLAGYERELFKKFTVSMQFYVEQWHDVDAMRANQTGPVASHREVWTQRLTYMTHQDKVVWSLFSFYSPTDEDRFIRPSIQYRHDDHWRYDLGANLFSGKKTSSFFGQFERSSNVHFSVKYQF